jgi:hypothetical protein
MRQRPSISIIYLLSTDYSLFFPLFEKGKEGGPDGILGCVSLFPSAFVVSGWGVESFDVVERATTGRPHLVPRDYLCWAGRERIKICFSFFLFPRPTYFYVSKGLAREKGKSILFLCYS